jgi:hypothetical protein
MRTVLAITIATVCGIAVLLPPEAMAKEKNDPNAINVKPVMSAGARTAAPRKINGPNSHPVGTASRTKSGHAVALDDQKSATARKGGTVNGLVPTMQGSSNQESHEPAHVVQQGPGKQKQ